MTSPHGASPVPVVQTAVTRQPRHANDTGWVQANSLPAPIADDLTVTFRLKGGVYTVEWQPKRPRINGRIWNAYKAARNAFLDSVHAQTGLRIRVIDL